MTKDNININDNIRPIIEQGALATNVRNLTESIILLENAIEDIKLALEEKGVTAPDDLKFSMVAGEIDKVAYSG